MLRRYNSYKLFPAKMCSDGKNMEPLFDTYIVKTKIEIRHAWEIGEHDIDSVIIRNDDKPIIPKDVKEPPVFKLLCNK